MTETMDRFSMSTDRKTDKMMQNILQELLEHFEDTSYNELQDKLAEDYGELGKRLEDYDALAEIDYMQFIVSENLDLMKEIEEVIDDYCVSHGLLSIVMSHFWYIKRHGYNEWLDLAYRTGLVYEWDGTNLKDSLTNQERHELGTWL